MKLAARWFAKRSLRTQIVSLMVATVVIGTAMLAYLSFTARMRQTETEVIEQAQALVGMTARATASAMLERDYSSLELFLGELMSLPGVQTAELVHPGGKVAMRASQAAAGPVTRLPTNEMAEPPPMAHNVQGMLIHSAAPLISGLTVGNRYLDRDTLLRNGWVRLELDPRERRSAALRQWMVDGIYGAFLVAVVLGFLSTFLGRVFRPISELAAFTSQLATQPGATVKIRWGSREVRELGRALNFASERLDKQIQTQELRFNQLRAVLDTAADAIVGVSSDGHIASTNPAAERMFGLDAADLHTRAIAEFLPGLDAPRLKTIMDEGMLFHSTQSRVGRVEIEARRHDGTVFPVELLLGEIAGDQELRYTCIVRDLTDMKLAEEYLTLYGRVLDCIPNGISVSNARRYPQPIVHVNPAFTRITGYAAHEVLGRDASFMEGEKTDAEDLALLAKTVQNGNEIKLTLHNYRKDGGVFHNKLSVSPVLDASGQITHYINVIEDVTAQVEVKERLIERTARLNATFDLSPDGFTVFDANGELITSNAALRQMLGQVPAWMPMARFDEWMRSLCEEPERYTPITEAATDGLKHTLVLARPSRRVLERDIRRQVSGSRETFVYFRDITHQFEVDRMKSEFLATAAHELRTPLASILGFTELLLHRKYSEEKQKDLLQTVHRQGNLLQNLIQELLDLSRIEARQGKDFHIVPTALTGIVEAALNGIANRELGRQVQVGAIPELSVMADASKIEQAVVNLLSNAIKYSPQGGDISVSVREAHRDGTAYAVISIQDQGIGMTPEQLARAFERFYRADGSGNIPGTGLGLNLVKEIAEIHGGSVELSSEPDVGTVASLWLPLADVTEPAATANTTA
ncbi:MAG: PAS domain S-box protein [Acidovorax sp.]|uniref:sensor histidine kinase n=1 Tax=Acidovorax sp. TaxID=1872122 RepID=UPI00261D23BA|nr:PAS domain S-box protein [Acidovorax sp.]MDH4463916.1 PAS domain S-box protein [Acidovorax sp.]